MHLRRSTKLTAVAVSLVALTAVGAALARTPGDPVAPEPTAPLYSRVLELGDLQGFWPTSCPVAVTSPTDWARHSPSASTLTHNGFVNGLREPLRSNGSAMSAVSSVAQYRTAQGARLAADEELATVAANGSFDVPSIPDAYGFSVSTGVTTLLGVTFSDGRFEYLLTVGGVAPAKTSTMRARLVVAALGLYRRAS